MNSIRQFRIDFRSHILDNSRVSDLLDTRFYSVRAGQREQMPYVVMNILDNRDDLTHSGPTQLEELRVQLSIFAKTTSDTDRVRDEIVNVLCPDNGLQGLIGSSTKIGFCILDNELDLDESVSKDVSKVIDFRIKLK